MSIETYPTPPDVPNVPVQQMDNLTRTTGSRGGVRDARIATTVDLAQHLFEVPERWGWEYVEPRPAAEYPHLAGYCGGSSRWRPT